MSDDLYPGFPLLSVPDEDTEMGERLPPEKALELLAAKIRVCRNCELAQGRTQAVPGEGNPHPILLFVGEAPGGMEDSTGRPFVGPSGRFLDTMLEEIGLERGAVFIANVNRCRPPGNRNPTPREIAACTPWLRAQLRILQPKVICPLGRFALETLVDPALKISKVHGQVFDKGGRLLIPLYHPAAALHRQDLRDEIRADMRRLRAALVERELW